MKMASFTDSLSDSVEMDDRATGNAPEDRWVCIDAWSMGNNVHTHITAESFERFVAEYYSNPDHVQPTQTLEQRVSRLEELARTAGA